MLVNSKCFSSIHIDTIETKQQSKVTKHFEEIDNALISYLSWFWVTYQFQFKKPSLVTGTHQALCVKRLKTKFILEEETSVFIRILFLSWSWLGTRTLAVSRNDEIGTRTELKILRWEIDLWVRIPLPT